MDVSGVDVAFLSNEEIFNLCSDIIDASEDEIFVLDEVNVNNLPDDKVAELYDDIMYNNDDAPAKIVDNSSSEQQVLDENYNFVDADTDEIALYSGYNINVNNLSEAEILALYNDTLDSDDSFLIAAYSTTCSVKLDSYYRTYLVPIPFYCVNKNGEGIKSYMCNYAANNCTYSKMKDLNTPLHLYCTGYKKGYFFTYIYSNNSYKFDFYSNKYGSAGVSCK